MILDKTLPPKKSFVKRVRRAPDRGFRLSKKDTVLALKNALRYIPKELHEEVAPEFLQELYDKGRIYGYRFRPEGNIKAKPVDEYEGSLAGRSLQVMIDNNLDFDVALYPYELVTYGETGQVFSNWMQYLLVKKYLQILKDDQTLVVSSGHPVGLFPSSENAPRVISTNGLLVGQWDNPQQFHRLAALGVTNYGQMTAGGWMYIGPQGIVHGTYITLLNAGRLYLNIPPDKDLNGVLFVSSGLGGMSGAQPKAIEIAGGIGVIAEVDYSRIKTRHSQGWVGYVSDNLEEIANLIDKYKSGRAESGEHRAKSRELRTDGRGVSIAYHGNIVDLLEYFAEKGIIPELISDQTSCHVVYEGGYTPAGYSHEEARLLMSREPEEFKKAVDKSLRRHYNVLSDLTARGSHFWDYGNSFLTSVFEAGITEIAKNREDQNDGFIYPSYVEDIMGPLCFDRGYGPFRWVCLSGKEEDLRITDKEAMELIDPERNANDRDNFHWIATAEENKLVVGTKARILYADEPGRIKIALRFNELVRKNIIGPVMLGRDHHDVSGTDSPFRETANIRDGSNITADMSVQCFGGNIARGMTLVVLSNGGGVGIGRSSNGGNGILLDGSERMDEVIRKGLSWDVMGGVARRNWAGNENAMQTAKEWNEQSSGEISIPSIADEEYLDSLTAKHSPKR